MSTERTQLSQEIETALGEVLAHVRGEIDLPSRIAAVPTAEPIHEISDDKKKLNRA